MEPYGSSIGVTQTCEITDRTIPGTQSRAGQQESCGILVGRAWLKRELMES